MDWARILSGIIAVLVVAIGLPLVLRKRKKESSQKVEQLIHHLQDMGIKAILVEKGVEQEKVGAGRAWGQRSEGIIKIKGRNVDYINVTSVASQYGVHYFLNYLVRSPGELGNRKSKKTKMVVKKNPAIWGRVVDIEWKGDAYLSPELNFDYQLKDKLLQAKPEELKGGIGIFPEPKYEYARVRTGYFLPSSDFFEAIDIIAKHIKSGW